MIKINEIYLSVQGESSHTGLPCVFVRLTGCNLRCVWCDTAYAFHEGKTQRIDQTLKEIEKFEEISKEKNFLQLERLRNTIDLIHAIQSADSIMKLLSYYPTFKKDQMFSQIKRRISDCWERIMNSIIHQPEEDFLNEIINNLQIGRKNQNHIN